LSYLQSVDGELVYAVVDVHCVSSGGVNVSSDTATKSFSTSGFTSTAHVKLQESPTGKRLWLIETCKALSLRTD